MIIVSQDKNKLVNFDNIAHIFIEEGSGTTISYGKMSGCSETLGYYKTKERAKEVLQEIVSKYKTTLYNSKTNETVVNIPKVFEMPKE